MFRKKLLVYAYLKDKVASLRIMEDILLYDKIERLPKRLNASTFLKDLGTVFFCVKNVLLVNNTMAVTFKDHLELGPT